jgi:AcrR family transcriptional regulator
MVEVRDRILMESGQLFARYGIRSMTMDALAEEMGISKRTIYERFKDKDTLLMEVIKYFKQQTSEEAHRLIEQSENAIEALFRIMRMTISQMSQLNPAFFHDFKKYHSRVYQEFSVPGDIRDFSITSRLLEKGMSQGVFREDLDLNIVNHALHALFDLFAQESPMVAAGYDRKDMFKHVIIPFFRGISTPEGQKLLEHSKQIVS